MTGIRAGELAGLTGDALTMLGNSVSVRIPVGKLHNDRDVPLLPPLVELIANYQKLRGPIRSGRLLERDDDRPFVGRTIHRYVERVANRAGVGHVDLHQLRHTMATRFIIASNNCNGAAKPRRRAGGGGAYHYTLRADEGSAPTNHRSSSAGRPRG